MLTIAFLSLTLSGCVAATSAKSNPIYKVGTPYNIDGNWYYPSEQPDYSETGMASWYGDEFHGLNTANGEVFDMYTISAAHKTLPIPSIVRVENLENGRSIKVRLNDRGPFADDRIIDMSMAAAEALGFKEQGLARVRVKYIGRAPLHENAPRGRQYERYASTETRPVPASYMLDRPYGVAASSPDNGRPAYVTVPQEDRLDLLLVGASTKPRSRPINSRPVSGPVSNGSAAKIENKDAAPEGLGLEPNSAGDYYIQIASFASPEDAEAFARKLGQFQNVLTVSANVKGKSWSRVRLGPFSLEQDAVQSKQLLIESGMRDSYLVRP